MPFSYHIGYVYLSLFFHLVYCWDLDLFKAQHWEGDET
jgi:hypothetical protein